MRETLGREGKRKREKGKGRRKEIMEERKEKRKKEGKTTKGNMESKDE